MILAGIDMGTNALRLLIAEAGRGALRQIRSDRRITRLGQQLDQSGVLSREAGERSLQALGEFAELIARHGARHTAAVGTSALREALNAQEFIDEAKRRTGLVITVVSGEEEARLTLLGAEMALTGLRNGKSGFSAPALVIDIGGGSTELISTRPDGTPRMISLPLGAVYLTERFIKHDPPSEEELAQLRAAVRNELAVPAALPGQAPGCVMVGTAGTITTLAAVHQGLEKYDPDRINRSVLTLAAVEKIVEKITPLAIEARRRVPGIERGREDIILAGAVITLELMRRFRAPSMFVSDWGLREGILLDLSEKLGSV